jgi:hypothetical protein
MVSWPVKGHRGTFQLAKDKVHPSISWPLPLVTQNDASHPKRAPQVDDLDG